MACIENLSERRGVGRERGRKKKRRGSHVPFQKEILPSF